MKINKVIIENFLSVEKTELDFDKYEGLVHVIGQNRDTSPHSSNGAGKSSLIEAVVFALFGKTIRKTSEKSLVNAFTKGRCKVVLHVNDNVVITRTKKPPSLIVEVEGKSVTKEGVSQTQDYLEEILNINYHVFLASIVFGQQNNINFLSCTAEEKRSIIQNFLNLTDLFKHRSKIRSLKSQFNSSKKIAATLQSESLQKTNKLKKQLENCKKEEASAKDLLTEEKHEFITKYSLSEIQELEAQKTQKELDLRDLENELNFTLRETEKSKSNIEFFSTNSICEHCQKQPDAIQVKLKENKKRLEGLYEKISGLRKEVKHSSTEFDGMFIPISSSDYELVETLNLLGVKMELLRKSIREQQALSRKYSKQMEEAQKKYDIMKFWESAFSEHGLVKYIIRNVLEYFNERANHYLSTLSNNSFTITFDDSLSEEIKSAGNIIHFESLSGGEKKKFSISVMMALNDLLLLSGKDESNVIFFDEVGDSLDREGVKGLYELISNISTNKKLFLITHNSYLNSLIEDDAKRLFVHKKNNITVCK
jgi:DNA repair exonuclease SbcCD ATPase subunit